MFCGKETKKWYARFSSTILILCIFSTTLLVGCNPLKLLPDIGSATENESAINQDVVSAGNVEVIDERGNSISLKEVKVGDVIHLGELNFETLALVGPGEFAPVSNRGDFGWLVLDVQDGKMLLMSKDVIGKMPYMEDSNKAAWKNSTLRSWLNKDFINSLPSGIQGSILETELSNEDSMGDTTDRVFLLSFAEAISYLPSFEERQAVINIQGDDKDGDTSGWWLRSPVNNSSLPAMVLNDGGAVKEGGFGPSVEDGIRPAFWIKL